MDALTANALRLDSLEIIVAGSNPSLKELISAHVADIERMQLSGLYYSITLIPPQGTYLYFLGRKRRSNCYNSLIVKSFHVHLERGEDWEAIVRYCLSPNSRADVKEEPERSRIRFGLKSLKLIKRRVHQYGPQT